MTLRTAKNGKTKPGIITKSISLPSDLFDEAAKKIKADPELDMSKYVRRLIRSDLESSKAAFSLLQLFITLFLSSVLAGVAIATWADAWPVWVGAGVLLFLLFLVRFNKLPKAKGEL